MVEPLMVVSVCQVTMYLHYKALPLSQDGDSVLYHILFHVAILDISFSHLMTKVRSSRGLFIENPLFFNIFSQTLHTFLLIGVSLHAK